MFQPVRKELLSLEEGVVMHDECLGKDVFVAAPILLAKCDNPRAAKQLGHMGAQAKMFRTMCMVCFCAQYVYACPTVHALKKVTLYGRTTPTATGVLRSRLRAYYAYGYGRTTPTAAGVLGLRLRAYYAYGYGRIAATTTGVLQAYYGLADRCKLTSGHYNRHR